LLVSNKKSNNKFLGTYFIFGKLSFKMNQGQQDSDVDDAALAAIPHRSVEKDSHGRVIKLRCRGHDWDMVPPQVCTLTRLQELDLSHCVSLTELPPQIQNLKRLQKLDLSHCVSLTTLPPEIGDLTNLEELTSLCCRNLSSLPSEIGQLKNLRVLDLGSNNDESVMSLPPEIRNLSSLEDVTFFSGIHIVEFIEQGGMEGWTSLRRLCMYAHSLGDNEYLRIFRHLPSWLVALRLRADIDSIDFLSRVELPSRIRELGVGLKSSSESDKQSFVDLLIRNRYLGFICSNFHNQQLYSPLAEHYLDINESGRCLLIEGDHPIPLSVWPIVLERVNRKLTQRDRRINQEKDYRSLCRRANAVYYLLHGPALAARESLV
jgi:hypothetical protein